MGRRLRRPYTKGAAPCEGQEVSSRTWRPGAQPSARARQAPDPPPARTSPRAVGKAQAAKAQRPMPWVAILAIGIVLAFAAVVALLVRSKSSERPQPSPQAGQHQGGARPVGQAGAPAAASQARPPQRDAPDRGDAAQRAQDERERIVKELLAKRTKAGKAKQGPAQTGALAASGRPDKPRAETEALPPAVRPLPLSEVPGGAKTIFVNNEEVLIENLADSRAPNSGFVMPAIHVPMGRSLVSFGKLGKKAATERGGHFAAKYDSMRRDFMSGSSFDIKKLANLSRERGEDFREPYVPHFMGCYYHRAGKLDAACRKYRRAISINPCFGLSHLNLARAYYELCSRSDAKDMLLEAARPELLTAGKGELVQTDGPGLTEAAKEALLQAAKRELLLAHHLNIYDVFGVDKHIQELAKKLELATPASKSVRLSPKFYTGATSKGRDEDGVVRAALMAARRFVSSPLILAKIESNMGVYYTMDRRYDLAVTCYLKALGCLKGIEDSAGRRATMRQIYQNLHRAFHQRQWAEEEEYTAILKAL